MFINDVKRSSFMEIMTKVAKRHGCSIEFEYKSSEPEWIKINIGLGNRADREYMIEWGAVTSLTDIAVDIWADFFANLTTNRSMSFVEYACHDVAMTNLAKTMLNSVYSFRNGAGHFHTAKLAESTLEIKDVIFNGPATIVFWNDGSKTVVKCQEGDEFDPEKGLAMAISKKALGNKFASYNVFKKWMKKAPCATKTLAYADNAVV